MTTNEQRDYGRDHCVILVRTRSGHDRLDLDSRLIRGWWRVLGRIAQKTRGSHHPTVLVLWRYRRRSATEVRALRILDGEFSIYDRRMPTGATYADEKNMKTSFGVAQARKRELARRSEWPARCSEYLHWMSRNACGTTVRDRLGRGAADDTHREGVHVSVGRVERCNNQLTGPVHDRQPPPADMITTEGGGTGNGKLT